MTPLKIASLAVLLSLASVNLRAQSDANRPQSVINFAMLDQHGRFHELKRTDSSIMVLFFTANGCPIARQSAGKLQRIARDFRDRGVTVWMINSSTADDRESIREEAQKLRLYSVPILIDDTQGLARFLEVERTGEAFVINATDWSVVYRGAIDDQLVEGASKPQPSEHYLRQAIEDVLAGRPVGKPQTHARGCRIFYEKPVGDRPVEYARDVAPILLAKCAGCHRPGDIGPWSMTSHRRVRGMAEMIEEVILARRMPPWHADAAHGDFSNDRSLTKAEAQTLLQWIDEGAEPGEGDDPLLGVQPAPTEWPFGEPDFIVRVPSPQAIPANGVLDYKHFQIKSPYDHPVWIGAIVVRPDNRKVVHHVIIRAQYADSDDDGTGRGAMLAGWAPGIEHSRFPEGTGRYVGANAVFDLEVHYTTVGTPESDQSEVGLYLLPEKPARTIRTIAAVNTDLSIPPGETDYRTFATLGIQKDTLLYTVSPHMHLRGSWFQFEALFPDGTREILLSVPRYDFNWQTVFELDQPKFLPRGTWILCTGGFDNSPQNPANPDSKKRIHWGDQSWDEMFIGFMEVSDAPQGGALTQASESNLR